MNSAVDIKLKCEAGPTDGELIEETPSPSEKTLVDGDSPADNCGSCSPIKRHWIFRIFGRRSTYSDGQDDPKPPSAQKEDRYAVMDPRFLETKPEGYAQVATFQSSDPNFLQYRRFGYLHCRLLSDRQYSVERLEEELDVIDRFEMTEGEPELRRNLICKRQDGYKTPEHLVEKEYPPHIKRCRSEVLSELHDKLLQYDNLVLKSKEMMSIQRPSNRDYESTRTWFRDNEPLVPKESCFIRRKEDLISLRSGRESAVFEGLVEVCLNWIDDFLQRRFNCQLIRWMFLTPELRKKTDDKKVRYYAPSRVNKLVNLLITAVIFILLILPVIIMYKVTEIDARQSPLDAIGVLIVFTLVFGMAVSSLTTAKRHELFGASAAYAAVLVVFIGNFGVQQVEPASPTAWTSVFGQILSS